MIKLADFAAAGGTIRYESRTAPCGCAVHPVDTPGTKIPLRTTEVVVHWQIYRCPQGSRYFSVLEPVPVVVAPAPPRKIRA